MQNFNVFNFVSEVWAKVQPVSILLFSIILVINFGFDPLLILGVFILGLIHVFISTVPYFLYGSIVYLTVKTIEVGSLKHLRAILFISSWVEAFIFALLIYFVNPLGSNEATFILSSLVFVFLIVSSHIAIYWVIKTAKPFEFVTFSPSKLTTLIAEIGIEDPI